jgi:hypothetical protein
VSTVEPSDARWSCHFLETAGRDWPLEDAAVLVGGLALSRRQLGLT